jgi:hypothetical protein
MKTNQNLKYLIYNKTIMNVGETKSKKKKTKFIFFVSNFFFYKQTKKS